MSLHTPPDFDALVRGGACLDYLGLAPFLRASIAGADLRQASQHMLHLLDEDSGNADLLMNLAIAMQCLNQKDLGLAFQAEALSLRQTYTLPASRLPARLRLLVLVTQGSIQSNTPLECLLEQSDIELVFHYVTPADALLAAVPAHDILFVGISDSDANRPLLQALQGALQDWPRPVLNSPRYLHHTGRDSASRLLQGVPRLLAPQTQRVSRQQLQDVASGRATIAQVLADCDFPIIVRPLTSQAGADLQKIDSAADIAPYLAGLQEDAFFTAPFIDYRDAQGHFKKIRIALIGGEAFVCHMAVSENWMIHYVNAGMYAESWKRVEEARFMQEFPHFVEKHRVALDTISQRMQLDYLVMDCAETAAGDLLLFEIDHGGVVHAMDVESLFPYKNAHIAKAKNAFCELLYGLLPPAGAPTMSGHSSKVIA